VKLAILVALLSLPAFAQEDGGIQGAVEVSAADAPLVEVVDTVVVNADAPVADAGETIILRAGEPAPVDGLLLPTAIAIAEAKRHQREAVENASLRGSITPVAWWAIVTVGVLAAGAGVGLGYGLAKLPPPK